MSNHFFASLEQKVGRDVLVQVIKELVREQVLGATAEAAIQPEATAPAERTKKKWKEMSHNERLYFVARAKASGYSYARMSKTVSAPVTTLAGWAGRNNVTKATSGATIKKLMSASEADQYTI